ncbi:MAG: PDZ domain-containing protein [Opitutaceae bacterium]|nr:PDZ domain-containing protein [Opitutaceae bacterium]
MTAPTPCPSGAPTPCPKPPQVPPRTGRRHAGRHVRTWIRRSALGVLLMTAIPVVGATPTMESRIPREDRRPLQDEALLVIQLLQNYHYASRPFHDLETPDFLDRYLSLLDPDHLFLTAEDTVFVHRRFDRNLKTVYLFSGDLRPSFEIVDLFTTRALARCDWLAARLQRDIALDQPGELTLDRQKAPWPANAAAADALWEQWLQAQLAGEIVEGRPPEEGLALLRERNAKFRARLAGTDPLAIREQFLSCLLECFDPHSGYFSQANADEFNIGMAGTVAGIGLELKVANGRFFAQSVYPGGPCDLQGHINPGDELVAVAEANDPPQPLAGLRLRQVARLIRGKPESHVTLSVRSAEQSEPHSIELTRARVGLPANHARAFLVQVPGKLGTTALGIINLPSFYGNQPTEGGSVSMAAEVRELLGQLTEKGAKGVVVDLRDNGGGLMIEAAKLAGLFLAGGPLLFAQGPDGRPEILRDEDPTATFAGPLIVLTSRQSASASEAFAGAMQCYHRALIVGAETTFGKGTVQSYIDIRNDLTVSPALKRVGGVARVTRQLYYLPDGRSPQLTGVLSDIQLPSYRFPGERAEDQLPHALPATVIVPPEPLPETPGSANPACRSSRCASAGTTSTGNVGTIRPFLFRSTSAGIRWPSSRRSTTP